ncbi:MAG: DUF4403 family protein [Pseudomonadota bacterium]
MAISKTLKYILGALALLLILFIGLVIWSASQVTQYPAPPRVEAELKLDVAESVVVTRATAPIGAIVAKLETALPTRLVTIDKRLEECVPKKQVKALGIKLFKTPRLGCNLVGEITRGPITLGGSGTVLRARVPLQARIEVQDLGDIIKRETVTAAANVTVTARLGVGPDWTLNSELDLSYTWTTEPGIDVAGQRITFTGPADDALAKSLDDIERELEGEIRKVDLRSEIEKAWRGAHDTVSINRENPPVWMRITPREVGAGSLSVSRSNIAADLMLGAALELKVGDRLEPAEPGPLGANIGIASPPGFDLSVPVLADYRELEPVILKALRKLSADELIGDDSAGIEAEFKSVELYATQNGRLAVGIEAHVVPTGDFSWARAGGTIWLTGEPMTKEGSEVLSIENLKVYGDMDRNAGDLLLGLMDRPVVKNLIQKALVTDFRKDYDEVVLKAEKGLKSVKVGTARLSFDVEEFEHGVILVTGAGLYMPVTARGAVSTRVAQ